MTIYNRPDDLPAWAESGDKIQPNNAEIQAGWPLSNVPPSRQRFNWILNFVANAARYFMQRGVSEWSSGEDYPAAARVQHAGETWNALQANSGVEPGTDPATWERWGFNDSEVLPRVDRVTSKDVSGNSDVTLTASEADVGTLILTGALTGNINVILPNNERRWIVWNNTSGSFTLSVKTSSGAAVVVPQSNKKAVYVFCDGANNVILAGSANDAVVQRVSFTATSGQTDFSVVYTPGAVFQVSRNGALVPFTASDGSKVVIAPSTSGDEVVVYIAAGFQVANAVSKGGDTMTGPLTLPGGGSGGNAMNFNDLLAQFSGSNQKLEASGYQKLPGGLILQWGQVSVAITTTVTVTLPVAFPNACLQTISSNRSLDGGGSAGSENQQTGSAPLSATQIQIRSGITSGSTRTFTWLAIGY